MLSVEGAKVVMVENGKQAVDEILRSSGKAYDLVLMDIQMPEMDGYEATRQILMRAPDLPIVAQTAHAMSGEMDRCRAVGMVDQLTKPIDCERLVSIVRRNCRPAAASPLSSKRPRSAESIDPGATLVDWPALQQRYAHKPEFLLRLLATAMSSLAATPGNLRSALRDGDTARTIFLAHSLKGAAGNLLAAGLAKKASDAELACRGRAADADDLTNDLADAAESLLKEITEYLVA
jgi:CheY-like chemotaxis protein